MFLYRKVRNSPKEQIKPPDKNAKLMFLKLGLPGDAFFDISEYSFFVTFNKNTSFQRYFSKAKTIYARTIAKKEVFYLYYLTNPTFFKTSSKVTSERF